MKLSKRTPSSLVDKYFTLEKHTGNNGKDRLWPKAAIGDCWLRSSASERKAAIHLVEISAVRITAFGQQPTLI